MIVVQDGSADNGKIRIGADKIVGEDVQELEQAVKGLPGQLHGDVLLLQDNAVFIVINIGGILEVPGFPAQIQGQGTVRLAGRMIDSPCVPYILRAEQTFGIAGLRSAFECSDFPGVFFRLGQIDGDVQIAKRAFIIPFPVFCNTIHSYVIGLSAQTIKIIRCGTDAIPALKILEFTEDLGRPGQKQSHNTGVQQIPEGLRVFLQNSFFIAVVQELFQNRCGILRHPGFVPYLFGMGQRLSDFKEIHQPVSHENHIALFNQLILHGKVQQFLH